MRGLTDKDVALLNEGRDGVIGWEEEEADGEDEEAETVGEPLHVIFRFHEHGGHHHTHDCQHHLPWEEELRCAPDIGEVAAHKDPYLREVGVGKFGSEVVVPAAKAGGDVGSQVVYLIHSVVTAMRSWGAWEYLIRVCIVTCRTAPIHKKILRVSVFKLLYVLIMI